MSSALSPNQLLIHTYNSIWKIAKVFDRMTLMRIENTNDSIPLYLPRNPLLRIFLNSIFIPANVVIKILYYYIPKNKNVHNERAILKGCTQCYLHLDESFAFWPCFCKFQQQQQQQQQQVCWTFPNIYILCGCTVYMLRVFPDAVGYTAFQNKYCRHHTNWRLRDGWLWKPLESLSPCGNNFWLKQCSELYPLLISFWPFFHF